MSSLRLDVQKARALFTKGGARTLNLFWLRFRQSRDQFCHHCLAARVFNDGLVMMMGRRSSGVAVVVRVSSGFHTWFWKRIEVLEPLCREATKYGYGMG